MNEVTPRLDCRRSPPGCTTRSPGANQVPKTEAEPLRSPATVVPAWPAGPSLPSMPADVPDSLPVAGGSRLAAATLPCRTRGRFARAASRPATTGCGRSSSGSARRSSGPTRGVCGQTPDEDPILRLFRARSASAPGLSGGARPFDVPAIRKDFPILHQEVHGKPLAWLDNAATTQKPQSVIDALSRFYAHDNSNIHRGAHTLAARATDAFEQARQKVQAFLGASLGQGNRLRPRNHRRHQSRRPDLRPEVPAAGRRDRALHARTSRQHRSLADGGQGKGRRAAGHPGDRPGRDHARTVPGAARAANQAGRADAGLEQPGHDPARRRNDADGQALQRPRADRRGAVRGPPAGERAAARLRLLRLLRATRFSAPRASAWCTPRKSCWRSCRPGKAAAT